MAKCMCYHLLMISDIVWS